MFKFTLTLALAANASAMDASALADIASFEGALTLGK